MQSRVKSFQWTSTKQSLFPTGGEFAQCCYAVARCAIDFATTKSFMVARNRVPSEKLIMAGGSALKLYRDEARTSGSNNEAGSSHAISKRWARIGDTNGYRETTSTRCPSYCLCSTSWSRIRRASSLLSSILWWYELTGRWSGNRRLALEPLNLFSSPVWS